MTHLRARADAEEVLSIRHPGQVAIVWYSDDNVYHERLMIWRSNPTTWFVLTPDGDFYQEDWSGLGDDGPVSFKVKGKGMDFQYFSRITQPVYRFREYPDDETFKGYIEQALTELGELGTGTFSWTPRKIYQMDGREVEASEFLGRLLVPRRIRRRDGGVLTGPVTPAGEGHMWAAVRDSPHLDLGKEVTSDLDKAVQVDSTHGHETGWTLVRLLKIESAPAFIEEREKLMTSRLEVRVGLTGKAGVEKKTDTNAEETEETSEDARTLSVYYDDQGERYRSWREATKDAREYAYSDWPLEGPQSVLHLMKYMLKNGGSPKQWLQIWARHKGVYENDRAMHEMRPLLECFEHAGCYDQLNLGSLASFQTLGRRVQSIVDAYNSGTASSPDWGAAKIMSGYQGPEDLVSPNLRSWAAKKGKEEVELAAARTKMREYKKLQAPVEDAAAGAVADGNLPAGGVVAKPKKRAKAKQLAPPGDQ